MGGRQAPLPQPQGPQCVQRGGVRDRLAARAALHQQGGEPTDPRGKPGAPDPGGEEWLSCLQALYHGGHVQ